MSKTGKSTSSSLAAYVVMSERGVETRRTDKKVAEEDCQLIREILRRAAWIEGEG